MAEKHLQPDLHASRKLDSWPISLLLYKIWGPVLVAAFSIPTLSDWNPLTYLLSVLPVAALLVVYVAFMPRSIKKYYFLPLVNVEEAIGSLSMRALILSAFVFGVQTVAFGLPTDKITLTLSLGLTKALSWYFMIKTVSIFLYQEGSCVTN